MPETNLILALLIPLVAAVISTIPYKNLRDSLMLPIAGGLLLVVYKIYTHIINGGAAELNLFQLIPGVNFAFKVEPLGMVFAIILAVLWVVSLLYSIGYMPANNAKGQGRFFAFYNLAIFASLGIAFSSNLFTLFIFYELLSLSTYPLVAHHRGDESRRAGRLYLGTLVGASMVFLLPAIIFTLNVAGTLDFISGGILQGKISPKVTMLLLLVFVLGIAKVALMPMHRWLPAAMVAPTPVSALLHAVAVVKAGAFTILKVIVYIFGINNLNDVAFEFGEYGDWLLYISAFTIIIASSVALFQDNLKRLLAYSTISQLAYIIMAAAMFTPKAIIAAALHMVAHAFAKITLFFAAGSVATVTGRKKISELEGVGRIMPITMAAFTIAALSVIGLPPTIGFLSKWYIFDSAMGEEQFFVVAVIILSTLMSAAYFLPIIYKAFFEKWHNTEEFKANKKYVEAPLPIVLAIVFAAFMVLYLFVKPDIFTAVLGLMG